MEAYFQEESNLAFTGLSSLVAMPKKKDSPDPHTFGGRLFKLRTDADLGRGDLAVLCGVSVQAVGQWEHGVIKNLKFSHLFTLADKFKVEPRWLALGQGPKPRHDAAKSAAMQQIKELAKTL